MFCHHGIEFLVFSLWSNISLVQSTNVPCSKHRYHSPKANITVKQCSRCLPVVLRKGVNGGKREGERSERESVVTRQNKDSRRVGGHAPPQRHLERSAATMKTRFTGRKQPNELREVRLLSSRPYQTLLLFPVMPHVLYVVVFVENIEHFAELFSLLLVELNVVGRYLFLFG